MGKMCKANNVVKASKDAPQPKTKSKFVRVTREEAARLRINAYPYII